MLLKNMINTVALAAIGSAAVVPMSTAAEARDWGRGSQGFEDRDHGGRYVNRWGDVRGGRDHDQRFHRRRDDGAGAAVAVGAFAVILGLALAAQSQRVQDDDYRD